MRLRARSLGALLLVTLLVPLAYCTWASLQTARDYGYEVQDMDWNRNGEVSFLEFFASSDVGARPADEGGCREFFSLKDGTRVREVCASEDPTRSKR